MVQAGRADWLVAAVLAWAGPWGCVPPPSSRCTQDQDCARGNVCDTDGVCRPGQHVDAGVGATSSSRSGPADSSSSTSERPTSALSTSVRSSSRAPSTGLPSSTQGSSSTGPSTSAWPSSSTEGPSSTGPSSSGPGDAGAVRDAATPPDAGAGVPLEALCDHLAAGYRGHSINTFIVSGDTYAADFTRDAPCRPAMTDDELMTAMIGTRASVREDVCGPHGVGTKLVEYLAAAQLDGRLLYLPDRAEACLRQAREARDADGGFWGARLLDPSSLPVGLEETGLCRDVVVGLRQTGQGCQKDLDCSQEGGGASCSGRVGAGCQGVCTPRSGEGGPCRDGVQGLSPVDCAEGLVCQGSVCLRPVQPGHRCVDGSGVTSPCTPGFICAGGVCRVPRLDGEPCSSAQRCDPAFYCDPYAGRCVPLVAEGGVCEETAACHPCHRCLERNPGTGAPAVCTRLPSVGETCLESGLCVFPLVCVAGRCAAWSRSGEPCQLADGEDPALRGTCLSPSEACYGEPRTCRPRHKPGDPCWSRAGPEPTQGSCRRSCEFGGVCEAGAAEGSLEVCTRRGPGATEGVCTPAAQPGERCGRRFDLNPSCVAPPGTTVTCTARAVAEEGWCVHTRNGPFTGACQVTSGCGEGLYCLDAGLGMAGTCALGGMPGEPCGILEPHGTACTGGFCASMGDGGWRCTAHRAFGDVCLSAVECGPEARCQATDAGTKLCRPKSQVGETCRADAECVSHAWCVEGLCTDKACRRRVASCISINCDDFENGLPFLLFLGAWGISRRRRG
jgi:hypothetical protein